jgi:hypothetical protein
MKYIWLFIILLTGCGTYTVNEDQKQQTEAYLIEQQFKLDGIKHGRPDIHSRFIEIEFVSSFTNKPGVVGRCSYMGERKVSILRSYWLKLTQEMRRLLIYHELGHCLLDKYKHSIDNRDIMYESIIRYEPKDWSNMIERLFQ